MKMLTIFYIAFAIFVPTVLFLCLERPISDYKPWKMLYENIDSFCYKEDVSSLHYTFVDIEKDIEIYVDYFEEKCFVCMGDNIVLYSSDNLWMSHKVAKVLIEKIPEEDLPISRKTQKEKFIEKFGYGK